MKAKIKVLFMAMIAATEASQAWAGSPTGAAFLAITPSVRSYGLGMANGITALGAEAVGANPANLGLMPERFDVYTSYAALLDGTEYEHLSSAIATPSFGALDALGVSITRMQVSGVQGSDTQGNLTGSSYGAGDTAIALTGSASVSSRLRLGLTGKVIQSQLAGYSSNMALAGDVGATYTLSGFRKPISVGFSITNLGQGVRFISQTDSLPTAVNLGVAAPLGGAMFVVEVNHDVHEQQTEIGTGIEYTLGAVSFRGGYLAQNQSGNLALQGQSGLGRVFASGLTAGIGVKMGMAQIDYSLSEQAVEFGMTQRVALSLHFGGASSHVSAVRTGDDWRPSDRSDWMIQSMGSY